MREIASAIMPSAKELGDDLNDDQVAELTRLQDKNKVNNEKQSARRKLRYKRKLESLKPIKGETETKAAPDVATSMEPDPLHSLFQKLDPKSAFNFKIATAK